MVRYCLLKRNAAPILQKWARRFRDSTFFPA
jgi:hypothetical protein